MRVFFQKKVLPPLLFLTLGLFFPLRTFAGGCGQGGAGWICAKPSTPNSIALRAGWAWRPDEYFGFSNRLRQSLGYGLEQFNAGSRELFSNYPAFAQRMMGTAPASYGIEGWLTGGGALSKNMAEGAAWVAGGEAMAPAYFGAARLLQSARSGLAEGTWQTYQWGSKAAQNLGRSLESPLSRVARREWRATVQEGVSFERVPDMTPWGEPQVTIMARVENKIVGTYPIVESSPEMIKLGFQKTAASVEGTGVYTRGVGEYLAEHPNIKAIESTIENIETVKQLNLARWMGWDLERAFAVSPLGRVRAHWGFTVHEVKYMPIGKNNYYWTMSRRP